MHVIEPALSASVSSVFRKGQTTINTDLRFVCPKKLALVQGKVYGIVCFWSDVLQFLSVPSRLRQN